ncbi:MAG: metallophosphoesterase [Candidatus Sericytochromatia bacterium]|nr:metallophosphoesterase [Candidatus Sericytochromatia bacterium]
MFGRAPFILLLGFGVAWPLISSCATGTDPWVAGARPAAMAANLSSTPADSVVFSGAGDIAFEGPGAEQTARILDGITGAVFTLGDNAYQSGSAEEFARFYHPTWGRHLSRTFPVVGNHEYRTPGASGYFAYFGPRAGDPGKGYYAFDLNPFWRVYSINSADETDGASKQLGMGSEQYRWLAMELDTHRNKNTIAMWHHPRFSSGAHGDNPETDAIWRLLVEKGVDIALWGHDHHYERFHPADVSGREDEKKGLRSFVVGTGGKNHYPFFKLPKRITAVRNARTFGVLKLTLHPTAYDWKFLPAAGGKFSDEGRSSVR